MTVTPITSLSEFSKLINSGKVIIIDFWATWCGPCKVISPVFEKLAKANKDNANVGFYKVDVDEVPDVAEEVGIRAMPTFMVFHGGNKVQEFVGAVPRELELLVTSGINLA